MSDHLLAEAVLGVALLLQCVLAYRREREWAKERRALMQALVPEARLGPPPTPTGRGTRTWTDREMAAYERRELGSGTKLPGR